MADGGAPGTELLVRLELLHARVAALIEHRSADDPTANDPLRGLLISADAITHLLHRSPSPVPADDEYGTLQIDPDGRIGLLMARFDLTPLDFHLLLVTLAPDVDRRFEALYGYLNDDVSRRR